MSCQATEIGVSRKYRVVVKRGSSPLSTNLLKYDSQKKEVGGDIDVQSKVIVYVKYWQLIISYFLLGQISRTYVQESYRSITSFFDIVESYNKYRF